MRKPLLKYLGRYSVAGLICLAACAGSQVRTRHDAAVRFETLHTYAWAQTAGITTGDPRVDEVFLDRSVRQAVDAGLAARGYRRAPGGEADFLVTYRAAIKRRLDSSTSGQTQGYLSGWWGPSDDVGQEMTQPGIDYSREYDEGTLVLDFLDPRTKGSMWHASAKTEVFPADPPEQRERQVTDTVTAILERFPPK